MPIHSEAKQGAYIKRRDGYQDGGGLQEFQQLQLFNHFIVKEGPKLHCVKFQKNLLRYERGVAIDIKFEKKRYENFLKYSKLKKF